ncbi:MAG: aminoglycoside phosphotransferase family protein [Pseudomonadota bacterium]
MLKADLQDVAAGEFEKLVTTQATASDEMRASNRVPAVLSVNLNDRAFLMEAVKGEELYHLVEEAEDHLALLQRAGAWIDAFHRAGLEEQRIFRPGFNSKRLKDLREQVKSGRLKATDEEDYLRALDQVLDVLPDFAGKPTQVAWQHGDLNLHNLLMAGDEMWGIDFTKVDPVPIGYDVARFLLHYSALLADHGRLEPGWPAPPAAVEAFFKGYQLATFDDPSIQAILRVKILNDWTRYPVSHLKMKTRQRFRFERYRDILRSLMAA